MKEPILYKILRPILTVVFKILYRPTIIGSENILSNGRLVLAGNHTNNFDCIFLMASTKRIIHFLAKDELSKGIFSFLFKNMGIIFVNRREKDRKSLEKAIEYLNQDKVIGIFPEGTINKSRRVILPFKFGAVKMTSVTNSYIVPFVIKGEYKMFRKGLTIIFNKPYKVNNDLEFENKKLEDIISFELTKRS